MVHLKIVFAAALMAALCASCGPSTPPPAASLAPLPSAPEYAPIERDYWQVKVSYSLIGLYDVIEINYVIAPILSETDCIAQKWQALGQYSRGWRHESFGGVFAAGYGGAYRARPRL